MNTNSTLPTMSKKMMRYLGLLILIIGLFQCKQNEAQPEQENELITTVRLKFTIVGETTSQTFTWKDTDGAGGNAPQVQLITLKANKTYQVGVEFLDESASSTNSMTEQILKKGDEHLIIISTIPGSLMEYTITDKDSRNLPIGLTGMLKTNGLGSGTLNVRLRHQPPINNVPTKDGTPNAGSDDVNVTFNVVCAP